jgi:hypothetical protein
METNTKGTALNGDVDLSRVAPNSQQIVEESSEPIIADAPKTLLRGRAFLQHAKQNIAKMLTRVELPWLGDGHHIFVRPFTSKQRGSMEQFITRDVVDTTKPGKTKKEVKYELAQAYIAFCCACDANGEQIFIGCDLDEIADSLDAKTAQAIQDAATKASGISAGDIEQIAGN